MHSGGLISITGTAFIANQAAALKGKINLPFKAADCCNKRVRQGRTYLAWSIICKVTEKGYAGIGRKYPKTDCKS